MWQYNQTPDSDELYHYGVVGMKWGVRRYQNKDGSLTPVGKQRLGGNKGGRRNGTQTYEEFLESVYSDMISEDCDWSYRKHGPREKLSQLKKKANQQQKDPMDKDVKTVAGITIAERVFPELAAASGRNMHCSNCVVALELRQRGYDVIARPSKSGKTTNDLLKAFDGAEATYYSTDKYEPKRTLESKSSYSNRIANSVLADVAKEQGDGARGCFRVAYRNVSVGHVMNYEVQNGKTVIYDSQSRSKLSGLKKNKLLGATEPSSFATIRLDNAKPTEHVTTNVVSTGYKKNKKTGEWSYKN